MMVIDEVKGGVRVARFGWFGSWGEPKCPMPSDRDGDRGA